MSIVVHYGRPDVDESDNTLQYAGAHRCADLLERLEADRGLVT